MKISKYMLAAILFASTGLGTQAIYGMEDSIEEEHAAYEDAHDHYVPVVTPTVNATEGVVEGTGRAVKGTAHGTGKILTGHPISGSEEIVTETVGGAGDVVESAVRLPFNILSGK